MKTVRLLHSHSCQDFLLSRGFSNVVRLIVVAVIVESILDCGYLRPIQFFVSWCSLWFEVLGCHKFAK